MSPLRVAVVAQIPFVREGLRALLKTDPTLRVTALAPSDELGEELASLEIQVVLLDVQVLERDGWELVSELSRALPRATLIVLGDDVRDRRAAAAMRLGARGYLLRDASAEELANAIRAAHTGTFVLHPLLTDALLAPPPPAEDESDSHPAPDDARGEELIEPLSERELDVLRLITRGLSNKQIASELVITEHTVKFHIRAILGKLGAANRTEAVILALQKGLVNL